jgi:hypothetical protein
VSLPSRRSLSLKFIARRQILHSKHPTIQNAQVFSDRMIGV